MDYENQVTTEELLRMVELEIAKELDRGMKNILYL